MSPRRLSSFFNVQSSNLLQVDDAAAYAASAVDKEFQSINNANEPKALKELREQIKKGLPASMNTSTVSAIIDVIRHKDSIDDRKLLLEHVLTFVSQLEPGPLAVTLKNKIIELLYNDLSHPPATSLSTKYAWRTADGSYNNIDIPDLGRAGTPYSRSVQQSHPLPKNQLPDAGLVFDTLLKREKFVKHPGGLSSLMFSFAALVIHSVFRTSHRDWNINETSSYVDLAPLYGNNQTMQDKVRMRNGRGMLLPDVFAEDRLLLLPPAVCVLLVLFNRNHNYISAKLLEINERGTYMDPDTLQMDDPASKVKLLEQEEELFQTARLINCGWFAMVVFSDYFSCILGLVRKGNSWSLIPFDEIRKEDHEPFERGKGNACSVEFNCLYRWHAAISQEDEAWTEKAFNQFFSGKAASEDAAEDLNIAARKALQSQPDIKDWTFDGLLRQADGSFKDDDLANILHNSTEHSAAAFRARGTPAIMRLTEVMGIEQNRKWGVCSLNDFRVYLGLKPFKSFIEWNSDPEIADAAEKLYGDIDYLELYVGLQAEEAKPLVEGAGLCPGYTISRAILSDAIALTRGDRFYTHDFTPFNLTAWGFADCQRDPNAFGFGSTLGRLFLRTLPNNYTENSVYTFFPLMTPSSMKTHLTNLGVMDQYDLSRPKSKQAIVSIEGFTEVTQVLKDKEAFTLPFKARVKRILHGKGFFPVESNKDQQAIASMLSSPELVEATTQFFYDSARKLIIANCYSLVGSNTLGIDIVRQVLRVLPVYWVAEIAGIHLKTNKHPQGVYTAAELYDILADIYSFIFLNIEASRVMVEQEKVKKNVHSLLKMIKHGIGGAIVSISGLVSSLSKSKKHEHHTIVKKLFELGHTSDYVANSILALMVVSTVEVAIALTNVVNFYIDSSYVSDICSLAKSDNIVELEGYIYEALRLDPILRGVFRISNKDHHINGKDLKKGEQLFVNVASTYLDSKIFPDPLSFNVKRPIKDRLYAGCLFKYLGEGLTVKVIVQVLRAIFEFDNVRRAPGQSGVLHRFKNNSRPELCYAYQNKNQLPCERPGSMSILWDAKQ